MPKKQPKISGQSAQPEGQPAALSPHKKQVLVPLLTGDQVAQCIGTCRHTVARLTKRGLLPAIVLGRRLIRYSPDDVERYIQSGNMGFTQLAHGNDDRQIRRDK